MQNNVSDKLSFGMDFVSNEISFLLDDDDYEWMNFCVLNSSNKKIMKTKQIINYHKFAGHRLLKHLKYTAWLLYILNEFAKKVHAKNGHRLTVSAFYLEIYKTRTRRVFKLESQPESWKAPFGAQVSRSVGF